MQIACWEMPWFRALRAVALVLTVVLGLEWTVPLGGYAQSTTEPASAPAPSVGNQDLPPIQEAESVEARSPFYKTWWFWAIVVVAIVVSAVAIAAANSDGDVPIGGAPSTVTVERIYTKGGERDILCFRRGRDLSPGGNWR